MQLDLSEFKGQQHYSSYEIAFHLPKRISLPKRANLLNIVGGASLRGLTRRRKYGAWGAEHEPAVQGYTLVESLAAVASLPGMPRTHAGDNWDANSAPSGFIKLSGMRLLPTTASLQPALRNPGCP